MKVNPDSIILQQLDEHWQKMAMLILYKLAGRQQVRITAAEIEKFSQDFKPGIAVLYTHGHKDSIDFQIVDQATAERLAAHDATTNKGRG